MENKKIFISHSSRNKEFASWISDLLVCFGVDKQTIFYSSDFRTGVRGRISYDVFDALKTTVLDIVIISSEYKESEYCLNEAGIIWFKDREADRIIIALPAIAGRSRAGFIDEDYIQHRVIDADFLDRLVERLNVALKERELIPPEARIDLPLYNTLSRKLEEFKRSLPVVDNLSIIALNTRSTNEEIRSIRSAWNNIQDMSYNDPEKLQMYRYVFYKDYIREVTIYAADEPGCIKVKTSTISYIVNLSDKNYTEVYAIQFLKRDGGYNSFRELVSKVNGKEIGPQRDNHAEPRVNSPYIVHRGPQIDVAAHGCAYIEYATVYDISLSCFIQSKVLHLPCGNFSVQANFDPSFTRQFGENYIFRSQFIPPNPSNLNAGTDSQMDSLESSDKRSIHYTRNIGFPAGGGYVLTISKT